MRNLCRGVAALAMISGALAGCASPHYPINEGQAAGPPPLTMPKPQYPVTEQPASERPVVTPASYAPEQMVDATPVSGPPTAVPITPVESESLPPPTPAPATGPAPAPDSAPPPQAPAADTAAAAPASPPPEAPIAARTVIHDQTPSSPNQASAPPPPRDSVAEYSAPRHQAERPTERATITGDVVAASGVFENYEVQKGDHIDALARAFKTSRKVLLDANDLEAPYRLRPGQILKVPVAKAYVAERGDTLSGIARRFGVEAGELAEINHISMHASLRDGEAIGLPSSMHDRGPLREAGGEEYAESPRASHHVYAGAGGEDDHSPAGLETPLGGPRPTITEETGGAERKPIRSPEADSGYHSIPPGGPMAQATPQMSDAQVSAAAHGRFVWPVHGDIVTKFGPLGVGRRNDGVDIKAPQGSVVQAAAPGEVVYAGDQVPGYGNLVLIKHADGWVTAYAHLDKVSVQMKQQVAQGEEVGSVGMSGGLSEPELHFEVRYAPTATDKARPVDPVLVLPMG